jgi:putative membrane protein
VKKQTPIPGECCMKNVLSIYFTDMKNTATNWAAAVVVLALIVLPSLYAWFNIKASWNPYGNSGQIPVGVVNEDKEASVLGRKIHAGTDLIDTLKKNHSFGWHFDNRDQAMKKLKAEDYYAVIVIPKDFSEKLSTVVTDNPSKATIQYYVNEKINAIAPKITEKGASAITEQISSKFISTVDGVIFDLFNTLGLDIQKNLPDIEQFQRYLFLLDERLPEIKTALDNTSNDVKNAKSVIGKIRMVIPLAKDAAGKGLKTVESATDLLTHAQTRFNSLSPQVKADLAKVQTITHQVDAFVSTLKPLANNSNTASEIRSKAAQASNLLTSLQTLLVNIRDVNATIDHKQLNDKIKQLERLSQNQATAGNGTASEFYAHVQQLETLELSLYQNRDSRLAKATQDLGSIQQTIKDIQTSADQLNNVTKNMPPLQDVQDKTTTVRKQMDAFINDYNDNIEPAIRTQFTNGLSALKKARAVIVQVQAAIPQIETLLLGANEKLVDGQKVLTFALSQYPYVQRKVSDLANKVRDLNKKANINDIIQLLINNPGAEKGFFAEPVVLKATKLFPIANYGTGMTPFYTVLAIWVGGLLLISLLSTDVHVGQNYTGSQMYFGKGLTFLTFGLLQTCIVTTGDMWLMGVSIKEPVWFVLFGVIICLVFVLIVYTLVSVFGNVGKAMAIVLLVLQISGSGGTFPVVLLPKFFQTINPFLPFTFAISLMREAIGGIVWQKVSHDLLLLTGYGILAIILGAWLKGPINKYSEKLKEISKRSGLFH